MTANEQDDSVFDSWYNEGGAEPREVECKHCDGTGVDRRTGADCWNCYGDGTILLED